MNIPSYEKKDYSYLQNAFQPAQAGFSQMSQGISSAIDIGDKLRKRAQEEELLSQLKISRKDAETVRENAIVEAATQIHEAMGGGPDDVAGMDRARVIASQIYYKPTAQEWKDGTAVQRFYKQERDELPKILTKIKTDIFNREFVQGGPREAVPQREPQAPVGTVGVEQQGTVQKPLTTTPTSVADLQETVLKSPSELPERLPSIAGELTSEGLYNRAVELDILDKEGVRELIGYIGRKEAREKEYPGKIYQGAAMRETLSKPIVTEEGKEYAKTYEKEMTEGEKARLENERLRAKRPYSSQVPGVRDLGTLLNYGQRLEESRRKISGDIAKYEGKLQDQSLFGEDETVQSIQAQLNSLNQQKADVEDLIDANEFDINTARGKIGYPQPPSTSVPTSAPESTIVSDKARNVVRSILEIMRDVAPRGYKVETQYGDKNTWSKGKGKKKTYLTKQFNKRLAQEVLNYAKTVGVDIPIERLSASIQKNGLEETVDAIMKRGKEGK